MMSIDFVAGERRTGKLEIEQTVISMLYRHKLRANRRSCLFIKTVK